MIQNYFQYYLVASCLTFFALVDILSPSKFFRPYYLFLCAIILSLFAGLRGSDFVDYNNYVMMYDQVYDLFDFIDLGGNDPKIHGEYLYLFLNSVVKSFFGHSVYVFVIVSFLAVSINLYCFNRLSPYPMISVLWYFSHLYLYKELIQIRAGVGSAFVLLSVIYIQKQRSIKYIGSVVVASLFHAGAIVTLPVYWMCKLNFSRKVLFLPIIFGIILGVSGWLDGFMGVLTQMNMLPSRVSGYRESEAGAALGMLNPIAMKQAVVCCIAIYYKDFYKNKFTFFYPLLMMYILSTAWLFAFQEFGILAARVATFLAAGDPILVPSLILLVKEKRLALVGVTILALIMLSLNLLFKTHWGPYSTIFQFL